MIAVRWRAVLQILGQINADYMESASLIWCLGTHRAAQGLVGIRVLPVSLEIRLMPACDASLDLLLWTLAAMIPSGVYQR